MAQKNLGFGGTATSTYATLSQVIAEFAPERFQMQIQNTSPLLASGALEKQEADGEEWTHTVIPQSFSSTGWVRDFGPLPRPASLKPEKIREQPANVFVRMELGRSALNAKMSDESMSSLLDTHLQAAAEDGARHLARGIHGGAVNPAASATWSGTAADSTVSVTFTDISIFKPGAAYDFVDDSANLSYVVRCTGVTPGAVGSSSANVAGTVTFTNDVPDPSSGAVVALGDTAVATGDSFRLRGETAGFGGADTVTGDAINSFDDIAGSGASSSLHGLSSSTMPGWVGHYRNINAPYNQEAVIGVMTFVQQYSGDYPTHVIMSPALGAAHAANSGAQGAAYGNNSFALQAYATRQLDQGMDKYGEFKGWDSGLRCGGVPIILDPNCQASRAVLHHKDKVKLVVWKELGPDEEAGDPLLLSRSLYSGEVQFSGQYNLCTYKRSAIAVLYGFTNL